MSVCIDRWINLWTNGGSNMEHFGLKISCQLYSNLLLLIYFV